jgi:hypothetical protein
MHPFCVGCARIGSSERQRALRTKGSAGHLPARKISRLTVTGKVTKLLSQMTDLFYRVTVGADEGSARNPMTSNSLLVELICDLHSDLIGSDPEVAACDVTRKVIKQYLSTWSEPGYLAADKVEGILAWHFSGWSTLDCGCKAVLLRTPCANQPRIDFAVVVNTHAV